MQPRVELVVTVAVPEMLQRIEGGVQAGMDALADELLRLYQDEARRRLKTSYAAFKAGTTTERTEDGVAVEIRGWLPVALETGTPGFDLKPGFLRNAPTGQRPIPVGVLEYRTVSRNSPASSWLHPGIRARGIGQGVLQALPSTLESVFSAAFERISV